MYQIIVLKDPARAGDGEPYAREQWEQADYEVTYQGEYYTLRAGPRQPLDTDGRHWDPIAVYAPDYATEEDVQAWYAALHDTVEELQLKY